MTTRQLHQAVSRATGEDVDTIAHRGFSLVDEAADAAVTEWESQAIDWDERAAQQSDDRLAAA